MRLEERIRREMTEAMKVRATDPAAALRLSTLRVLLAEIKNAEIAAGAELDDQGVVSVITREAKKRREAVAEYERAGRADLVAKETAEADILAAYLPEQLSEAELLALVEGAVSEAGASGPEDVGKVMSLLMPRIKGRADGKVANRMVTERLTG